MSRVSRKNVAWLCLSALLFLHLALAVYACPTSMNGDTSTLAAVARAAQPCQGMDQERPKLCEQHCVHASQSVDTQPHSAVYAPVLPFITVDLQPDLHRPARSKGYGAFLVTFADPPPLVRFGVLRI